MSASSNGVTETGFASGARTVCTVGGGPAVMATTPSGLPTHPARAMGQEHFALRHCHLSSVMRPRSTGRKGHSLFSTSLDRQVLTRAGLSVHYGLFCHGPKRPRPEARRQHWRVQWVHSTQCPVFGIFHCESAIPFGRKWFSRALPGSAHALRSVWSSRCVYLGLSDTAPSS